MKEKVLNNIISRIASELHDLWRKPLQIKDTDKFNPKIKKLYIKDLFWIIKNCSFTCDIANTSFKNLPKSWQMENWYSAEVTVDIILTFLELGMSVNDIPIEVASAIIHREWVRRNHKFANPIQLLTYFDDKFTEEEREKDRVIWREGIRLWAELAK